MNKTAETTIAANTKLLVLLVLIAGLLWNVAAYITWDPTFIMNDGIQYLSTARNWLQGQGFSTNALIYNPHFQGRLPAPQTVWPPGLPSLLVVGNWVGISLQSTALLLNLLSNALSGLLIYLILRRCGTQILFALGCAALFYFTTISWHLAVALLSEPLFSLLILTALYFLPGSPNTHNSNWLLCGLFLAACIAVRYSGIFTTAAFAVGLVPIFLLTPNYNEQTLKKHLWRLTLLLILPILAFAALMIRTQLLVGTISRDTGVGTSKSVFETIQAFAEKTSILTGFWDSWIFSGNVDKWMFFALLSFLSIIVFIAIFLFISESKKGYNSENTDRKDKAAGYTITVASVVTAHAAAFGGYLAWCSLSSSPLNVTPRYLYQIYPGVFILLCLMTHYAITKAKLSGLKNIQRILGLSVFCLAVVYLAAQVNIIPVIKKYSEQAVDARDIVALPINGNAHVADIIKSCVGDIASPSDSPPTSLWSNEGIPIHFNSGVHTITLTEIYTTNDFDFEQLEADIADYNIRLFLFVNNKEANQGDYGLMLSSIKDWLTSKGYPKLQLENSTVASGTSIEIFATDSSCFEI